MLNQEEIENMIRPIAAAAKSLQLFPTLCNSIDSSPPGSAVPGILHARTLEWVAISWHCSGSIVACPGVRGTEYNSPGTNSVLA